MDSMVLTVQQWLNATYGNNSKFKNVLPGGVTENGITGTQVEIALITALQIELGIATPTGTFGPTTTADFTPMQIRSSNNLTNPTNKEYILQGGFWCKGYNPGGWTGIFYTGTQAAAEKFQADAGLSNCNGIVTAMIMKALLNTDPFVLSSNGDAQIRQIQQNLNNKYNAYTGLMPTDGIYAAETNTALIYALQAEEGLSTSVANGSFGPTTTTDCPTLSPGDSRTNFVYILQYALYCNGYTPGTFNGVYGSSVTSAVESYQSFMSLPVTGIANMPTIKALMASCGDTSRSASACDCATILTATTAATLKNTGYQYVGRYLTGTVGSGVSKALTAAEIQIIFNAGLKFFPIYESHGTSNDYFTSSQGCYDAYAAIEAAENLGIPAGSIIYFAVDYDAMDSQVTSNVLPYFQGVKAYFNSYNSQKYQVGVYGARNICSRVCKSGYAVSSFVGDMSTGYSGNIGYTMPTNWAFDQFTTVTIGSGSGQIQIDKDGCSGRYAGVDHVVISATTPAAYNNPPFQPSAAISSDPVDTSIGAHILQVNALKVKGAQDLSIDLSYNSAKLSLGTMGKGWSHNYEIKISRVYSSLFVYWTPSDYSVFTQNGSGNYTCTDLGKQNDVITVNPDGSYLLNRNNDVKYSFDSTGLLTNIQNRVGMNITVTKDSFGNLVVTEPISGQKLTVGYNSSGFVSGVTDQAGRSVAFAYDSNACLTTITDANGKITTYTYDGNGRVLSGTDGDGVCCFTDTYDASGRIVSQKDAIIGSKLTTFSYDTSVSGKNIVTITDRNGYSNKNIFNSSTRQLISTIDANSNTISYTYDSNGNIATETDALGNVASTTYDSKNHPLTQIDRAGAKTVKTYDNIGNLLTVVNPDGGTTSYTYDSSNRVIKMTDIRGNVTNYTYDANGLIIEKDVGSEKYGYTNVNGLLHTVADPKNWISTFSYDTAGRLTSMQDANRNTTNYTYDAVGNQLTKVDPLTNTTSFTYNSRSLILTQTDSNVNTTTYQYNGNGKMTCMTDPKGNATAYTYDGEDRLTQTKDAQGNTMQTAYDPVGRVLSKTDTQNNTTAYTYDVVGNLLTITKPNGGVTTYTYYANGKTETVTDAAGNLNTYGYDAGWRLSKITNSLGKITTNIYDNTGDLLSVTDQLENKTTYTYDIFGNMLTMTDPSSNVTTYTYDANNNRISQKDALENVTTFSYDPMNKLIGATDANGHASSTSYDASGRVISQTDALGNTTTISYDPNGNIVKRTDALGNVVSQTIYDSTNLPITVQDALSNSTKNTYDTLGRLSQISDPLSNKTLYGYDATGRLVSAIDPLSGNSSVTFDSDGNKLSIKNPLGGVINYAYDHSDRITSETTASSGTITYGYNSINLLSELTNARDQKRDYIYDDAGRIQSFTDSEGTTTYTYDSNGNVLAVTDAAGTITRQFDALNRITKLSDTRGNVIQYAYDAVGNLSTLTYPDGKTVTYAYDAANRLTTVTDWANRITQYTYDADGNLTNTERPDGSVLVQTYDLASRLISAVDNDSSSNVISNYSYIYDADGNMITETSSTGSDTASMTYDALNRLTGKTDRDVNDNILGSYAYGYDDDGNITSGTSLNQNATMTYDTNDKLSVYNGQNTTFDLNGNMTVCVLGGNELNFSYDSGNRLIQVDNTMYTYDAIDNRISSTVGEQNTQYVYENVTGNLSQLLVRTDLNGNNTHYVCGIGLIGHEDANGYTVYHYDYRGSTVALTNVQGVVTDTYTYGAYGELLTHTGTSDTPFLYNGRDGVLTEANGLYYMRARYYASEIKRFINADSKKGSINNSKSLNIYAFVIGNPISLIDPSGLSSEPGYTPSPKDVYDTINEIGEFAKLQEAGVKFEIRGNKIVVFGKQAFMQDIGIPQRIFNESNLSKYPNIAKYSNAETAITETLSDIDKSDVAVAAISIGIQTYTDVQSVNSTKGKIAVGTADVAIGAAGTASSIVVGAAAEAATGAIMGATIGSVVPGVGTVVGLGVGLLAGWLIDEYARKPIITSIEKSYS